MKIHEYQAKQILTKYGVAVPRGEVTDSADNAQKIAEQLGTAKCVVKAQIHAGGRGKGGGVKVASSPAEAKEFASKILGMNLVTHQTGPSGQLVRKILVEEGMEIVKEYYLGMVLDRDTSKVVIMASTEGGMEIEEVAATHPEKILKAYIDPGVGIMPHHTKSLAFGLGLSGDAMKSAAKFIAGLYKAFMAEDCSLAEINPLVQLKDGRILALDCKMTFDDNAMYRHPETAAMRDIHEEDPLEVEASKFSLNYIKLDGNIGCMVNGAGLAMATMDIVKHSGGEPANFLDVGGGASEEQIQEAFRLILADKNVKAIFINIFGGILRCDRLANGVVNAAKKVHVSVPVVVRMEGTNVDLGKKILKDSGLNFILANGMRDGAQKAVASIAGK